MGYTKEQLIARLEELQIDFKCYEHPIVLTVEAQAKYVGHLGGQLSKNLLLKDKKHRFYVISALANTNVDLKVLSQRLGLGKGGLRMAPEEALQEILQVPLGCVTPFALINDSASAVSLMLDQRLRTQEYCYFHPLTNDMTISINASDLEKFLNSIGKHPAYVDLEASPVVGKDNPPDLASLVPSEAPTLPNSAEKVLPSSLPVQNNVPAPKVSAGPAGKASNQSSLPKRAPGKNEKTVDPLAEATNIGKLVDEIVNKISANFTSEITKTSNDKLDVIDSSVIDKIGKHISSDLEQMLMTLKNAAYTQGFQAASQANKRRF